MKRFLIHREMLERNLLQEFFFDRGQEEGDLQQIFGWMVGWLDGWMVGWLDGWMVGW